MLATLVTVPELDGTFLEVEILVDGETDVGPALDAIHVLLHELGISDGDVTDELYTDAVARDQAARH
jgi:adenylate cyclase class 2